MMELLSPAGDYAALTAAIRNGADAVYLGGQTLNARKSAGNFDSDGLKSAADYCHERGKKLYITVNTLLKPSEFPTLQTLTQQLSSAGVDAAIVQDLGVAMALKQMLPSLPLHASTQMAIHNRQGVRFLKTLGLHRAVLAREMTYPEIIDCAQENLPLETFTHGALCVSCSGQCLFSSLIGGRSGNRGMCAQPCRLPYTLQSTKKLATGYLLSPKDLMTLHQIKTLEQSGAHSLKIEGRLKRPEYVAIVTRTYRDMLDNPHTPTPDEINDLKQIFNRGGFTQGYAPGVIDSELMSPIKPNHAGLKVGEITKPGRVKLTHRVSQQDSLLLKETPIKLTGEPGELIHVDTTAPIGEPLIRLADDAQLIKARRTYETTESPTITIQGALRLKINEPMKLSVSDGEHSIHYEGAITQKAEKTAPDPERIRAQLQKTGGTIYTFDTLELNIDQDAFAPISALNEIRRGALDQLAKARIESNRGCERNLTPLTMPPVAPATPQPPPKLVAQITDLARAEKLLHMGFDEITFTPLDITADALDSLTPEQKFRLGLPMVCTEQDLNTLHRWAWKNEQWIEGTMISNPAHLSLSWPGELTGDFSMNIANNLTALELQRRGITRYTPSVELTAKEIAQLGGEKELIVYGYLPLMQLRHCPLHAQRNNVPHTACHACDQGGLPLGEYTLIDRKNVAFPLERLKTQNGCIVRVLNSVPLMLHKHMHKLPQAAAWRFILGAEDTGQIKQLLAAVTTGDAPNIPSTTGHYFRGVE